MPKTKTARTKKRTPSPDPSTVERAGIHGGLLFPRPDAFAVQAGAGRKLLAAEVELLALIDQRARTTTSWGDGNGDAVLQALGGCAAMMVSSCRASFSLATALRSILEAQEAVIRARVIEAASDLQDRG